MDRIKTPGRCCYFRMPGVQRALVAFRCALDARAGSKLTTRRSATEGKTPELEAGQLKDLHAVLGQSVTRSLHPRSRSASRSYSSGITCRVVCGEKPVPLILLFPWLQSFLLKPTYRFESFCGTILALRQNLCSTSAHH